MKILSWNVNGIRAILKKDFIKDINTLYSNPAFKKGYSGTAILSKKKPVAFINDMGNSKHDSEGRVQCAEYDQYYLVNVYVPNSGQKLDRLDYRKSWDTDFLKYLKELEATKPVIICGDFNVAHQAMDLKNDKANYIKTAGYIQIEIDGMDNFINAGFVDVFRQRHPDKVAYTYWSYRFKARERNIGWRIDYFLVSSTLLPKITAINILSEILGSDHCPILLEIDL